jgi:hypothetical protein
MNKIIYFFFFSILSYSQVNEGFYITAGLSTSNFKTSDLITSVGTGYKGGIVFCVGENENDNFQLEIMYSNNVFSAKTIDNETYADVQDTKFNYASLDFGMYYNYYFFPVDEDEFYIGAQAGLTTAFGSTINPADSSLNNRNLLPNIIDVNKAFYELPTATFSPGAGITGGYNDMRFTLRYNQGLTNVLRFTETNNYDQSNRYIGPSFKGTFSSISFTVAYNL